MNVQNIDIDTIKPYWRNPRKNENAVEAVKKSIEKYGYNQPIVIDGDHVIIVGHTRYKALRELGYQKVPVVIKDDLSSEKAKEYRIADNKSNEKSEWDDDLLLFELREIEELDDMKVFFDDGELDDLIESDDDIELDDTRLDVEPNSDKSVESDISTYDDEQQKQLREKMKQEMREQIRDELARENEKVQEYEDMKKGEFQKKTQEKGNDYIEIECPHCEKKYVLSKGELLQANKLQRTL